MCHMSPSENISKQQEFVLRTIEERDIRFIRLWFTDILGTLKSVAIAPDDSQASFDVRSLYPSIPIQKKLQITSERLYTNEKLPDKTKWNHNNDR